MSGVTADQQVVVPAGRAVWHSVAFLHWPVPPERLQPMLPNGLTVDMFDGSAWISLTPFVMTDIRPLVLPGPEGFPRIPETNLRTYVRGPDGRDGLWFLSLDVRSAGFALAARATIGAPYHWGLLRVTERDGNRTYSGARVGKRGSYHIEVGVGAPITPSPLDVWLTGRWRAYTRNWGRLWVTPVQHEPWPLRAATLHRLEETLTESVGLAGLPEPQAINFSDGVRDVRVGVPRPAG